MKGTEMKGIVKNALLILRIWGMAVGMFMFTVMATITPLWITFCFGLLLIGGYVCLLITCDQIIKMVSDIKITEIAAEEVDNG